MTNVPAAKEIPMLIVHRGMHFYYKYQTGRDAFSYEPEAHWDKTRVRPSCIKSMKERRGKESSRPRRLEPRGTRPKAALRRSFFSFRLRGSTSEGVPPGHGRRVTRRMFRRSRKKEVSAKKAGNLDPVVERAYLSAGLTTR